MSKDPHFGYYLTAGLSYVRQFADNPQNTLSCFPRWRSSSPGKDKGEIATRIKSTVAAKCKALTWRAVFSSYWFYAELLDLTRIFWDTPFERAVFRCFVALRNGLSNVRGVLKAHKQLSSDVQAPYSEDDAFWKTHPYFPETDPGVLAYGKAPFYFTTRDARSSLRTSPWRKNSKFEVVKNLRRHCTQFQAACSLYCACRSRLLNTTPADARESYLTMSLVGGFSRDLPFPTPLHSGIAPYSARFTLIGSQDLDVKSRSGLPWWEASSLSTTHSRKVGSKRSVFRNTDVLGSAWYTIQPCIVAMLSWLRVPRRQLECLESSNTQLHSAVGYLAFPCTALPKSRPSYSTSCDIPRSSFAVRRTLPRDYHTLATLRRRGCRSYRVGIMTQNPLLQQRGRSDASPDHLLVISYAVAVITFLQWAVHAVSLLASRQANRVQSGFKFVRIVADDAAGRRVFSAISRFPPALRSGSAPYSARFILIGSQDLNVKSHPNISSALVLLYISGRVNERNERKLDTELGFQKFSKAREQRNIRKSARFCSSLPGGGTKALRKLDDNSNNTGYADVKSGVNVAKGGGVKVVGMKGRLPGLANLPSHLRQCLATVTEYVSIQRLNSRLYRELQQLMSAECPAQPIGDLPQHAVASQTHDRHPEPRTANQRMATSTSKEPPHRTRQPECFSGLRRGHRHFKSLQPLVAKQMTFRIRSNVPTHRGCRALESRQSRLNRMHLQGTDSMDGAVHRGREGFYGQCRYRIHRMIDWQASDIPNRTWQQEHSTAITLRRPSYKTWQQGHSTVLTLRRPSFRTWQQENSAVITLRRPSYKLWQQGHSTVLTLRRPSYRTWQQGHSAVITLRSPSYRTWQQGHSSVLTLRRPSYNRAWQQGHSTAITLRRPSYKLWQQGHSTVLTLRRPSYRTWQQGHSTVLTLRRPSYNRAWQQGHSTAITLRRPSYKTWQQGHSAVITLRRPSYRMWQQGHSVVITLRHHSYRTWQQGHSVVITLRRPSYRTWQQGHSAVITLRRPSYRMWQQGHPLMWQQGHSTAITLRHPSYRTFQQGHSAAITLRHPSYRTWQQGHSAAITLRRPSYRMWQQGHSADVATGPFAVITLRRPSYRTWQQGHSVVITLRRPSYKLWQQGHSTAITLRRPSYNRAWQQGHSVVITLRRPSYRTWQQGPSVVITLRRPSYRMTWQQGHSVVITLRRPSYKTWQQGHSVVITLRRPSYRMWQQGPSVVITLRRPSYRTWQQGHSVVITLRRPSYRMWQQGHSVVITLRRPSYRMWQQGPSVVITLRHPSYRTWQQGHSVVVTLRRPSYKLWQQGHSAVITLRCPSYRTWQQGHSSVITLRRPSYSRALQSSPMSLRPAFKYNENTQLYPGGIPHNDRPITGPPELTTSQSSGQLELRGRPTSSCAPLPATLRGSSRWRSCHCDAAASFVHFVVTKSNTDLPGFSGVAEPRRVVEVKMERRRNEGAGETGDPREDPPTKGIGVWAIVQLQAIDDERGEERVAPEVTSGRKVCDCEHQSSEKCYWQTGLLD
ncbi:hypothetical protein PR048_007282 [Dryococelus australis]|uniref:Uncharacterized protein n=1 Tax=Dryococelus australis TaxID=614101 RepID=A0ABQ9ID76_9NEOP|nr:hypothetical protein PR048_007282 [Dryococelus australis]